MTEDEKKTKNIIGQKFGDWTVLSYDDNNILKDHYICQCKCGTTKSYSLRFILSNGLTRCGRCMRIRDLTGQRFTRLTVLTIDPTRRASNGSVYWKCKCDCGNEISVRSSHLTDGTTVSCGCYNREQTSKRAASMAHDLTGKTFGLLTVLKRNDNPDDYKHTAWLCKCPCGKELTIRTDRLLKGEVLSCNECRNYKSSGEQKIALLLKENDLPFESQKTFDDCINNLTGYKYKFDFYVDNRYLIEFDGEQHFHENTKFQLPLSEIQYRDEYKSQWAKEHNIPLIRIPYTKLNSLTIQDLEVKYESN